jgi:hypothetical protein
MVRRKSLAVIFHQEWCGYIALQSWVGERADGFEEAGGVGFTLRR